jgi:hypothetical protein
MSYLHLVRGEITKLRLWQRPLVFALILLIVSPLIVAVLSLSFGFSGTGPEKILGNRIAVFSIVVYALYFFYLLICGYFIVSFNQLERESKLYQRLRVSGILSAGFHQVRLMIILALTFVIVSISFWINVRICDEILIYRLGAIADAEKVWSFIHFAFFSLLVSIFPMLTLFYFFSWLVRSYALSILVVIIINLLSFFDWPNWIFLGSLVESTSILASLNWNFGTRSFGDYKFTVASAAITGIVFLICVPFGLEAVEQNRDRK